MTRFSTRFSSCGGKEWGNGGEGHDDEVRASSSSSGTPQELLEGNLLLTLGIEFRDFIMTNNSVDHYILHLDDEDDDAPKERGPVAGGEVFVDTKSKSGDDDDDGVCCSGHFLIHCTWVEMGNICYPTAILVACVKHASP